MKLLLVDPFVTKHSPTMRGIVASLDVLLELFSEVEVWAVECDWKHPRVSHRKVPRLIKPWPLLAHFYAWTVNRWIKNEELNGVLVQTTGCILRQADIHYIQFWNRAFFEEAAKRPDSLSPNLKTKVFGGLAAIAEKRTAANSELTSEWWVVSRNLAERIATETDPRAKFRLLPNQYDPARFNHEARLSKRKQMRAHYGFQEDEKVMVFSAFGHFERKGLRQGIEAIEKLRRNGHAIRYLILGGTEETVKKFQASLSQSQLECCVFAGLVSPIEEHLAAADALLFPSHFEAFSLAEIEAAALGLRLYLTPHYGSEMILREPVNGRFLPWDPEGMAQVIGEDISNGRLGTFHSEMGEAVDTKDYQTLLHRFYLEKVTSKRQAH